MGYDLSIFKREGTLTGEALAERDEADVPAFTQDEMSRAAKAVKEALPALELHSDDAETFYQLVNENTGLVVDLFPQSAGLSMPYWHEGADAEAMFATITIILQTINRVVPIVVFDPQLGKDIDPTRGLSNQEASYYSRTTTHVQEIMANPSPKGSQHARFEDELKRKPWWKFW